MVAFGLPATEVEGLQQAASTEKRVNNPNNTAPTNVMATKVAIHATGDNQYLLWSISTAIRVSGAFEYHPVRLIEKVLPLWVHLLDQPNLPGTLPFF